MGLASPKFAATALPKSNIDNLPRHLPGRRNRRRSANPGGKKAAGHYVHGYWTIKPDGTKDKALPFLLNQRINPYSASLINTAVYNPGKQSWTLLFIHLDLDINNPNLDEKWLDAEGRISWDLVGPYLQEHEPKLFEAVGYVTRSTGGKGLALAIPVTPFVICDENAGIAARATHLQTILINVLNFHGLGADRSASGLKRFMPNFRNQDRLIYSNEERSRWVQNIRHFVIRELYIAYSKHPAVIYVRKTKRTGEFLHPDFRMERKLAKLLVHIDGMLGFGGTINMSQTEICRITGIDSASFYRSFLRRSDKVSWLHIEKLGGRKGYNLRYMGSYQLSNRAINILNGSAKPDEREIAHQSGDDFKPPEEVADGERNTWLWKTAAQLKHSLVPLDDALMAISILANRIPGAGGRGSWSLKNPEKICRSIYRNRPRSFEAPVLKLVPLHVTTAVAAVRNRRKTAKKTDEKNLDVGTLWVPFSSSPSPLSPMDTDPVGLNSIFSGLCTDQLSPCHGQSQAGVRGEPAPSSGFTAVEAEAFVAALPKSKLSGEFNYRLMAVPILAEAKIECMNFLAGETDEVVREVKMRRLLAYMLQAWG
jgi:hypothetical protein